LSGGRCGYLHIPDMGGSLRCLGLAYGGWGSRKFAEGATGPKPVVDCAHLDDLAHDRLPKMEARLENVRGALNVVQPRVEILTAENLH
jgi:hypothetical protein